MQTQQPEPKEFPQGPQPLTGSPLAAQQLHHKLLRRQRAEIPISLLVTETKEDNPE